MDSSSLKSSLLAIMIIFSIGCKKDSPAACTDSILFGIPIAETGLTTAQCQPTCPCADKSSKLFTEAELTAMKAMTNTQPDAELTSNPYSEPAPPAGEGLCGIVIEDVATGTYHLENFTDEDAAQDAGAFITHYTPCGTCSSLQDMAVYAETRNLGTPVKACGYANFTAPIEDLVACIEQLGFSKPCAQVWAYNVRNTQGLCGQICINANDSTFHKPDGQLAPCIECDERESGDVFKAYAGRTRRNSGLASSICRPCESVKTVAHDYTFL